MKRQTVVFSAVSLMMLGYSVSVYAGSVKVPPTKSVLDRTEKQLIEKWDMISALSASLRGSMAVNMLFPELGIEGSFPVTGKLTYRKNSSTGTVRVELGADLSEGIPLARFLGVLDNDQAYTETNLLGDIKKEPISPATPENGAAAPGGRTLFRALHAHFSLGVGSPQKLNGKEMVVIDGVPKDTAAMSPLALLRLYFDPSSGIIVYATGFDRKNVALAVLEITDIRCGDTGASR